MWKLFNFRWDVRTLLNVLMIPVILIRIPVVLFFWGIAYLNDWSEVICEKFPAWKSR